MVRVRVELHEGLVCAVEVDGHTDPAACAALSALVRTYAAVIDRFEAVEIIGEAPEPGKLSLQVIHSNGEEFIRGASAFILKGIQDVAAETADVTLYVNDRRIQ